MEIFLTVLFLTSALTLFLATTNFFENITKETRTELAEVRSSCESIKQNSCGCNGAPLDTRDYFITFFLVSSKENLKCRVPQKKLSEFKAGTTGQLTHKGSWFKGFLDKSPEIWLEKQRHLGLITNQENLYSYKEKAS